MACVPTQYQPVRSFYMCPSCGVNGLHVATSSCMEKTCHKLHVGDTLWCQSCGMIIEGEQFSLEQYMRDKANI